MQNSSLSSPACGHTLFVYLNTKQLPLRQVLLMYITVRGYFTAVPARDEQRKLGDIVVPGGTTVKDGKP